MFLQSEGLVTADEDRHRHPWCRLRQVVVADQISVDMGCQESRPDEVLVEVEERRWAGGWCSFRTPAVVFVDDLERSRADRGPVVRSTASPRVRTWSSCP